MSIDGTATYTEDIFVVGFTVALTEETEEPEEVVGLRWKIL